FLVPIVVSRSTDRGASFSIPIQISPSGDFAQGSEPAVGPAGEVYVTWFRLFSFSNPAAPSGIFIAKSTHGGASFGAPPFVAPVIPIGFLGGQLLGDIRVNSFPRIDIDPVNGSVYIIFASHGSGADGADVFFTRSTDGGALWSVPIRVNDDPGTNDQFFPDI